MAVIERKIGIFKTQSPIINYKIKTSIVFPNISKPLIDILYYHLKVMTVECSNKKTFKFKILKLAQIIAIIEE